jgi:hypothetical protein
MKFRYTVPSADEWDAMRSPELKALDVRRLTLQRAAMKALNEGRMVEVTLGGRVLYRLYPDGTSETIDGP